MLKDRTEDEELTKKALSDEDSTKARMRKVSSALEAVVVGDAMKER